MGNRYKIFITILLAAPAIFFALKGTVVSVPAAPNESIIRGIVSEYAIVSSHLFGIEPEQALYRVTVNVVSSESIGASPDFLAGRHGHDIQFYSREKIPPELFGKKIKAKARYKGDEKRGMFWISNIQVIEQEDK